MKTKLVLVASIAALLLYFPKKSTAIPITGAGQYKSHGMTTQGIRFKCGWKWWLTCWTINNGEVWIGDAETLIGYSCKAVPNDAPPSTEPTIYYTDNAKLAQMMTSGSFYNSETSEMETWYTFEGVALTDVPPPIE